MTEKILINEKVIKYKMQICKCGRVSDYVMYPEKNLIQFYCQDPVCGFLGKLQTYQKYVNPVLQNAPWRQI